MGGGALPGLYAITHPASRASSDTERVLDFLEEALVLVRLDLGAKGLGQALQQLALLVGNVSRGDDVQAHLQVPATGGPQVGDALAAQPDRPAGLRTHGDAEPAGLVQRRYLDFRSQRRLGDVDRQVEQQIVALAAEV